MGKANRYLLFYAILAVGLAFSWTQVGKRMQVKPELAISLLETEQDCRPRVHPCAAIGSELALVLGPSRGGFKLVGQNLPEGVQAGVEQIDAAGQLLQAPTLLRSAEDRWLIRDVAGQGRLRINLTLELQQWTAEFPLSPDS